LLAGRSGTENDFLTTRIARSEDLWFHVANVPGAHVVLRSPDGRAGTPPPELVERAASLAAWLSRLRAQDTVEVRWTERKRVRKPRKAPAGTVVMDQSRSLLVRPAPPPS
jgi:predicted ribosome quality control (RQC) complex YloA/Tae2 family protein